MEILKKPFKFIFQKIWPLLFYHGCCAFVLGGEYINLLKISDLIWPGDDFRLHSVQMGAMISTRAWMDGIMAIGWGWLADRYNRQKILIFGSTATSIVVFLNIFMPIGGGDPDFWYWLIIRIMIGFFMSHGGPCIHSLANDLLDKDEKSQFFGSLSVTWIIFSTIGMILSAIMFELGFWRLYLISGAGLFILAIVSVRLKIKEPKRGIKEKSLQQILTTTDLKYEYRLTRRTARATILSKSNLLMLMEGLFSCIIFGIIDMFFLPFIQSEPHNISPSTAALFMMIFAIPGGILGGIFFARLSDRFGKISFQHRIKLVIIAIAGSILIIVSVYSLPWPSLTKEEGSSILIIGKYPIFILIGIIYSLGNAVFSLYQINQPPIIQEVNLPEAQGTIRAWNQFIEVIGYGSGPLIGGLLLLYVGQNYQSTIQLVALFTIPGIIMWFFVYKIIDKDKIRIQQILASRAEEMQHKLEQI